MTVGQRIQKARKEKKLTQKELAAKLGLATGTIQQYELDKRQPRLEQFRAIASALNVDVNWLMNGQTLEERNQAMREYVRMRFEYVNKQVKEINESIEIDKLKTDVIVALIQLRVDESLSKNLLNNFLLLNDAGQEKAVERIEELTEIPKYQRKPEEGDPVAVDPQEDN